MISITTIDKINNFTGTDWSIIDFCVDYERIAVMLSYISDSVLYPSRFAKIICINYIGFSFIGHWDESVIEHIRVEANGDLVDSSLQEVKRLYGNSPNMGGGVKRVDQPWNQLNIKLIDGNTVKIACERFEFEML